MTTVYFIRHAEPDFNVTDDAARPLTDKGRADTALVTEFLRGKGIGAVYASTYLRAVDTVAPFAAQAGLEVRQVEGLRERAVAHDWVLPFKEFTERQWEDFNYKLEGGESLAEVQQRNIAALNEILRDNENANIAIGTHGTALCTILNYYDNTYGYEGFCEMKRIFPWVVKMEFRRCENGEFWCCSVEKIDLFSPESKPDYSAPIVRTYPLGALKTYKFTVTFARYKEKWLYCRHKNRDTYETAGGRVESGEPVLEAAKRELYEETGALKYDIIPAFDYSVHIPTQNSSGQVFLAYIHELGEMPPHEMSEVALFNTIPAKMRFPKILPELWRELNGWINRQNAKDEIIDIYDADKKPTGRTTRRGETPKPGEYRLVVLVWLINSQNQFLITRRAQNKGYPGLWENTGGSVVAGDDSITAAIREVKEETGLTVLPQNGKLILTQQRDNVFFDVWLFRQDFELSDVVLLEGETDDARYATIEEIKAMMEADEFVTAYYFDELTKEALKC